MRPHDLVVQLDAEAGAIGHGDGALHEQLVRLQDFRPPVDFAPLQLEQPEVLQHGADLDARGCGDRTARIVRRHLDAVGFGHRRDARELEQAAAVFDVGHDDVHRARAAERREPRHPNRISPPAIGCWMRLRISSVSSVRSGATGSSYHASFCGSSLRATRSASGTSKKLWQSTISSTSGPMASRIATTHAMPLSAAASMTAGVESSGGKPSHGAALTARNPSFTAARAAAAKPSGVRGLVARFTLA